MATDDNTGRLHYVFVTQSHFVRHNTPHPRELRARHGGKAPSTTTTRKDTGGDVTPPPTAYNFDPAAATPTEVNKRPPTASDVVLGNTWPTPGTLWRTVG